MNQKLLTVVSLAVALVLLLAINIFSGAAFSTVRLDLTENKLYTLSPGTRNILATLDEPVRLRLFLSQHLVTRLPGINSYALRVRELLDEYQRASDGKLSVTVIDPEPFSEEEDRAVGYGLQGIPLDEESLFYFGLVGTSSTDDEVIIPFLSQDREEFLEYDVTKLIYQLSHPEQNVIGLISSLPIEGLGPQAAMFGGGSQPWTVVEQMRQLFELRNLGSDLSVIPDEVDVLMLVHPKNLSDETLYAIDQFVLGGGHALVFVDPYAEADQGSPGNAAMLGPGAQASELNRLLVAWGLELVPSKVVGDLQLSMKVRFDNQSRPMILDYPVWMNLPPSLFDANDIVTGSLGNVVLATPGHMTKVDGVDTQVTPLISSSSNAMLIGTELLGFASDPQEILRQYRPAGESYMLAARVTGKAKSAFPDGPPESSEDSEDETLGTDIGEGDESISHEHLLEALDDINIVVVADTDLLQDRFWVQVQSFLGSRIAIPSAANGTFVINAIDNLTGSSDLISVRNRGGFSRPFTRVQHLRQEAELRFREKEQQLLERLQATEQKLLDLESRKQGDEALILSAAQQEELAQFREEKIRIRKELRDVRHELRKNIESLEDRMKFVNIGLMPLLIIGGGVVAAIYQRRRRKRNRPTRRVTA